MHDTRPMPTGEDLIGTVETAEILGIQRSTISRWVERGVITPALQLPGERGAMLFDRAAVGALKARIKEEGFPRRVKASS